MSTEELALTSSSSSPTMIIWTCMVSGSDENGSGKEEGSPFLTLHKAISSSIEEGSPLSIRKDVKFMLRKQMESSEQEEGGYKPAPKAALKKALNYLEILAKKSQKTSSAAPAAPAAPAPSFTTIEADPSIISSSIKLKLRELPSGSFPKQDQVIMIEGWVDNLKFQGKKMIFLTLRDGSGFLQCIISGPLCLTEDASKLTTESSIRVWGKVVGVKEGHTAPSDHEMDVLHWELVHAAPGGLDAFECRLNKEANPDVAFDQRHLVLRSSTTSNLMKLRSCLLQAFRAHYAQEHYHELTTPCLTQSQCEGGSSLFKLDYYGEPAYLTQSSQLYLETAIPSMGDVYCVQMSFRAEQSRTRRHLSEFTHIEAECPWVNFDELIDRIEFLVCDVIARLLESPMAKEALELNPSLAVPKRPFKRMEYDEAISWLDRNEVRKDDGTPYVWGDDIPEKPERHMVDTMGEPVFICRFPTEMKAFYMFRDPKDPRLTHSTDLLMPGVGEIVGGSMRIWDWEQLMDGYAKEGVDPKDYYWYTDQRKYGSCPHGGYGLGFERFLAWALGRDHVRDVCLYPRYMKRCTP